MSFRTLYMPPASPDRGDGPEPPKGLRLDETETRVLGSLLEKEFTTPDYYPLTLNALVNACNQKSNREPVVSYQEADVKNALESLQHKGLAHRITGADHRVPKYSESFAQALRLKQPQLAALSVLMLRGPQTAGEIRERGQRIYDFASLTEVEEVLAALEPWVVRLERAAGMKEPRYAHLLSGAPPAQNVVVQASAPSSDRVAALEREVERLRVEVESLHEQFQAFRKQFE